MNKCHKNKTKLKSNKNVQSLKKSYQQLIKGFPEIKDKIRKKLKFSLWTACNQKFQR